MAIKQDLAEPDPTRLVYRDAIKQAIRDVVVRAGEDPLAVIQQNVATHVPRTDRDSVTALIVEELRRLHEGVLARYGLRPSQFLAWKASQTP